MEALFILGNNPSGSEQGKGGREMADPTDDPLLPWLRCYARLHPRAVNCKKTKCGHSSQLRPKKIK